MKAGNVAGGWMIGMASLAFAATGAHAAPPAAPSHGAATSPTHAADHGPAYSHPTLPPQSTVWPGLMVLIVAGMFLSAAMIGIVVSLNMPEALPPPLDEHADSAHGHGGHHH